MSAENQFKIFKMSDGTFWLGHVSTGDVDPETEQVPKEILEKNFHSIDDAVQAMNEYGYDDLLNGPLENRARRFVLTEYGPFGMSQGKWCKYDEVNQSYVYYVKSKVGVRLVGQSQVPTFRHLKRKVWEVVETNLENYEKRVLGTNLWYTEAITMAHIYCGQQPGECRVEVPMFFYRPGVVADRFKNPQPDLPAGTAPWQDGGKL